MGENKVFFKENVLLKGKRLYEIKGNWHSK